MDRKTGVNDAGDVMMFCYSFNLYHSNTEFQCDFVLTSCLQLSTPEKVLIPERYLEMEPNTPLSPEELQEKQKKVERIKTLIAKSRYECTSHHLLHTE